LVAPLLFPERVISIVELDMDAIPRRVKTAIIIRAITRAKPD
jgi:hypothetical protein